MHVYKENNMLPVIFLCKQQIFSPGLVTRPTLIMSVAKNEGGGWEGRPIIFLSFSLSLFSPNLFFFFFTHVPPVARARLWISEQGLNFRVYS